MKKNEATTWKDLENIMPSERKTIHCTVRFYLCEKSRMGKSIEPESGCLGLGAGEWPFGVMKIFHSRLWRWMHTSVNVLQPWNRTL